MAFKTHSSDSHAHMQSPCASRTSKKQKKRHNLTSVLHNEWHELTHTVPHFSFYHSEPPQGRKAPCVETDRVKVRKRNFSLSIVWLTKPATIAPIRGWLVNFEDQTGRCETGMNLGESQFPQRAA